MVSQNVSENSARFWTKLSTGFAFVSTIGAGVGGFYLGHHYATNFQADPKIAPVAFAITGLAAAGSFFFNAFSLYMLSGIKKFHEWKGFQNLKVISAVTALNLAEIGTVGVITILAFRHLGLVASKGTEYMAWGISTYAASYLSVMAIALSASKKENPQIDFTY